MKFSFHQLDTFQTHTDKTAVDDGLLRTVATVWYNFSVFVVDCTVLVHNGGHVGSELPTLIIQTHVMTYNIRYKNNSPR
jgi:hypothetical protein